MAAKAIRYEVDGELYNGWIKLTTPEPIGQKQQHLK